MKHLTEAGASVTTDRAIPAPIARRHLALEATENATGAFASDSQPNESTGPLGGD